MTPEEHKQVGDVFARAIKLPGEDRNEFLIRECGLESPIYREVMSLLRHHREGTILEQESSASKTVVEVSHSTLDPFLVLSDVWEENRNLLRGRLVIIAIALAIMSVLSMVRLPTNLSPTWDYSVRIVATVLSLAIAWWLHRNPDISLRRLRLAEFVVIANICLLELVAFGVYMHALVSTDDRMTLVIVLNWHYIAWTVFIFVYGVFMPNTLRRAAGVLIPAAIIPLLMVMLHAYSHPDIRNLLFAQPFLGPLAASGVAIYAAHIIHGARLSASKAKRLAQYQLVRQIGDGGMGQVFEAEHLLLKRACAVKRIHPDRSTDEKALRRFQREVRATAQLTHPHTIEVYDYGETRDGVFFFAMELLPGMNLRDLVKVAGPLPPARAIHFLIDVCDALTEAHEAGMIHRDIKPANIFASQRGGIYDFTKLLDFGVVRTVKVDASLSATSRMVAGTPSYMSPEQATSPESVDARSDLYSVASVGYYLLAGRAPFVGKTPMQVMMAVVEDQPEPLSRHRVDVPEDLERIIMQCLSKDRSERLATARDLRDALRRCTCAGGWTEEDAAEWWKGNPQGVPDLKNSVFDTVVASETEG